VSGVEQVSFDLSTAVRLNALRSTAPASPHAPRVLLLHGFPEGAFIWTPLIAALGGRAHCVAPWLRGYPPSDTPADTRAYRARPLVADLESLIEVLGAPLDLLVAHDWGGALAWNLAALRPELLRHLLIINAPHPALLLRELRDNAAQRQASAYMDDLCRPDAAARLQCGDWAPLLSLFGSPAWLDAAARTRYRQQWQAGLQGALNYYAASPLRAGDPARLDAVALPRALTHVPVPTTVLWGMADTALLPGLVEGLEAFVPALRLLRLPQATHWLVHEQPQIVLREAERALALQPND
jgi:pimeloyl-ACP methyl ester carboxylesterase